MGGGGFSVEGTRPTGEAFADGVAAGNVGVELVADGRRDRRHLVVNGAGGPVEVVALGPALDETLDGVQVLAAIGGDEEEFPVNGVQLDGGGVKEDVKDFKVLGLAYNGVGSGRNYVRLLGLDELEGQLDAGDVAPLCDTR